jgi:hypothetical protein
MTLRQNTFILVLLAACAGASATFTTPPWNRPTTVAAATAIKSTYQLFDVFGDDDFDTAGIQDQSPDLGVNPNGNASVEETAGAFVTGTGNLYSPFVNLDLTIVVPGYAPTGAASTKFLLQIETIGSELIYSDETQTNDFSRFKINGTPIQSLGGFSYTELSRTTGTSTTVQHAIAFSLPTTGANYQLKYQTLYTSCSQSLISVDTFVAIPGDFDYDGDREAADVDLLLRAHSGPTPPALSLFDVNLDGQVLLAINTAGSDLDAWVHGLEQTDYGDANLDRKVDFDDLLKLAQHYGQPGGGWASGNFDGSNSVGFDDLLVLAQNYGFGSSRLMNSDFAADWALAQSLVPEPMSLGFIVLLGVASQMVRQRQKGV